MTGEAQTILWRDGPEPYPDYSHMDIAPRRTGSETAAVTRRQASTCATEPWLGGLSSPTSKRAYGGLYGAAGLMTYATSRLSRIRSATTPEELHALRRASWRLQGIAVLRPADVLDPFARQVIINEAEKLYGKRLGCGGQ